MTEPTITTAIVLSTGITVFGVATGLHPELLLAGFAGGLWYQSYPSAASIGTRFTSSIISAVVAAYLSPVASVIIHKITKQLHDVGVDLIRLPIALIIGFLTYRVIAPALLKFSIKHADKLTEGEKK